MNNAQLREYFIDKGFNPDEMFRQMDIAKRREDIEKDLLNKARTLQNNLGLSAAI
jgi:hypothetical protein